MTTEFQTLQLSGDLGEEKGEVVSGVQNLERGVAERRQTLNEIEDPRQSLDVEWPGGPGYAAEGYNSQRCEATITYHSFR